MAATLPADSVGRVSPQSVRFDEPLLLECGRELPGYTLAYETYGVLNADATNAILVCHALSGNHHAAGYDSEDARKPGWWEACIGPGKPLDTNRFFVVCSNNLGGCHGSTGPTSEDPATGQAYGADFPLVTVGDWVRTQARLADHLGIERWAAVAGGSLGGMQALQWAIDLPERIGHAIVIAAAPRLSAQNIAFNEVARQAIRSDPDFHEGRYALTGDRPRTGLMLARMLGHITYLSEAAMGEKFGRERRDERGAFGFHYGVEFEVESYLRHQGESFVDRFDANTYLLMTKALDYFDPAAATGGDLSKALAQTTAPFFVASFTSDWRFPPAASHEIVRALLDINKRVSYAEIEADHGHDAFLMPVPRYQEVFSAYMNRVAEEVGA
ncbi:homoserine O-succinyltransferase MetX [Spiribacter salinus]|uniref:homoserine O-succinyltransferase MetX n=1 Tax=Spiribacter salinus TaxID=1335746 RepID=UPI001C9766AE|nr:homoserine O-acetyltransferase [Spiribacter salinus]MBY5269340.1 homoserine O-acetyltransferase [Spiribacter salinus]